MNFIDNTYKSLSQGKKLKKKKKYTFTTLKKDNITKNNGEKNHYYIRFPLDHFV